MSKVQDVVFGGKERIRFDLSGLDSSAFDLVDQGDSLFKFEFRLFTNIPLQFTFPELAKGICWYCFGPVYAWLVPARLNSSIYTIDRIQFMLLQYEDGTYGAIFPLNHKENSFLSFQEGVCQVRFDDDKDSIHHDFHLAISFHSNPYLAINQVVDFGLSVLEQVRNEQILPDFFHYLGWCSWNAFGHEVSHSRLIEAAHSFREADLNIRWMIIDDGWMSVTGPYGSGRLNAFHPNSDKFPKGLANVIFELKQEYSIEKVGIWLTLGGYWHGIDPQSEFFMDYESSFLSIPYRVPWSTEEISDRTFSISLDKDLGIYSDWFEYLKGEGVDFLKIDHQNLLQEFCKHAPFPEFEIGTWFKAVLELAERIFGQGHVLHCMGMVPMAYLNTNGHGVYRISEDYFPHNFSYNPLAGNGAVHAVNNFSTAMWMHHLVNVDGDMFQSHHPHAYYHAAVRFLIGGVMYSTDFPGEFQMNLFRKLVNREGKLRRWRKPACPIPKCIFQLYEPEPYIVSSLEEGVCYLGIFNVSDTDEVIGSWSCDDIPGLIGSKFRATDWMTEESFDFLWEAVHDIRLERMGFKLYVLEGI